MGLRVIENAKAHVRMIFFIQTVLMDICRLAVELMLIHSAFNFMQTGTV